MKITKDNAVEVPILEGVTVELVGHTLNVKGEKGATSRVFATPGVFVSIENNQVIIKAKRITQKQKKVMGSHASHMKNMMRCVKEGVTYKLKICSGHFPMTVAVKGREIIVNNFIGEKFPRILKIKHEDVQVKIEGDIIIVTGCDKERTGQTAADIELLLKRSGFDNRIFQDGIYLIEKDGKAIK